MPQVGDLVTFHALSARDCGVKGSLLIIFVALGACSSQTHVEPKPRTTTDAARAAVDVHVTCGLSAFGRYTQLRDPSRGRGVMISERHVLTAAHVVRCPDIPSVVITLYDGRRFTMIVERDELTFGDGVTDIARLVIPSGSTFQRHIPPPTLGDGDGLHYMIARRSGTVSGTRHDIAARFGPGDSGAGVYSPAGALVGLLIAGDERDIAIARVDSTWLAGT